MSQNLDRTVDPSGLVHQHRLQMSSLRRDFTTPLDGAWEFQLRASDAAPAGETWDEAQVPSLWTMDARYGIPHYTNVPMPFEQVPPHIPPHNPVGVYRRTVMLDADQATHGNRTILHVGAAEGHLRAFVNGAFVGTSSDSHLAAEFDITEHLRAGANEIELRVAQWSSATYLEDQDQWWQAGISRSVGLISVPQVRLTDLRIVADFDAATGRGHLTAEAEASALAGVTDTAHSVRFVLGLHSDEHVVAVSGRFQQPSLPRGKGDRSVRPEPRLPDGVMDLLSLRAAAAPPPPEFRAMPNALGQAPMGPVSPAGTAHLTIEDLEVQPWTAETPTLYTLRVELINSAGEVVDSTVQRIGFRRVEIVGRDLLVNGQRILIQGVNRHDVDPHTGRVITQERARAELTLLKQFGVNAIRTSHYPNDPYVLDLCDEYGFYVVDEADVEGHAFASTIADNPAYLTEIVTRVQRMVYRDRNRPSVIGWSLGNETGYGAAHDAAAAWVRNVDPTRPVQYEGAIATDWYGGHAATDIACPMYPSFGALEAYSANERADRPLITCEYAYSQGNGTGGLDRYWQLFESLPGLQGGFIWEFLDHALDRDRNGHYAYGGDFGDEPNDGIVLLNGIAFADLTPKPAMWEMRGIFAPVRVLGFEGGALQLRNRQSFADLTGFTAQVRVATTSGDAAVSQIELPALAAGQSGSLVLPAAVIEAAGQPDALAIRLTLHTRKDLPWAPAGTEIAAVQHVLDRQIPALVPALVDPALVAPESRAGAAQTATLDTATAPGLDESGNILHTLVSSPPRLNLWRAMTDNDQAFALDNRFVRSGFFNLTPASTTVQQDGTTTTVETVYEAAFGDCVTHRRVISALTSGWHFSESVLLPQDTKDGLRVGVELTLVPGFTSVEWAGLGPWENYSDRRESALWGRWNSLIDDMAAPYVRPQSSGTRGGVTEFSIRGAAGAATVRTSQPMHLTVSRFTTDQLEGVDHWWELEPNGETIVQLDAAHRGVGTALLGPDTTPEHRLSGSEYAWDWTLEFE